MGQSNRIVGTIFIVLGASCLLFLLVWFLVMKTELVDDIKAVFNAQDVETGINEDNPAADTVHIRPDIHVPQTTGSTALKEYYQNNPRDVKSTFVFKDEDEGYEYYTRPDGAAWNRDSSNMDIAGDTKKAQRSANVGAAADNPGGTNGNLHVEFWESSVGYRGYQMRGNDLYLYGIEPNDELKFERHENGIWMYHKGKVYLLKQAGEDTPFEEINPGA